MDNEKTTGLNQQKSADKSKRFFIKKASAAAGIATLAPTSVWGACNASGISGGSQDTNTSCAMPNYTEGRKANFWKKWLREHPTLQDKNIVKWSVIGIDSSTEEFSADDHPRPPHDTTIGQEKRRYYYHRVADAIKNLAFHATSRDKDGQLVTIDIVAHKAIVNAPNTIQGYLSAIYLNRVFGYSNVSMEYQTECGFQLLLDHYFGMYMHVDGFLSKLDGLFPNDPDTTEEKLQAGLIYAQANFNLSGSSTSNVDCQSF